MKQNDIALIMVACFASVVVAYLVSTHFIVTPKDRSQQVPVVQVIEPSLQTSNLTNNIVPGQTVDPTQQINIGQSSNSSPFASSTTPTQ